ncbi:Leucine Rich Repeat [Seminavis robusta]|uniref:Leucine Rich Repeat n=1 Tax=Seminavis robusta TaxID=568900 RepID=A0A9N8ET75_9STRA|nr:Leucine Rich Repeat [Seminavis robusta]|eukprot:Sro1517_g279160.1 Leucine Rich Repeat (348) ;mRNA; f:6741-7784
MDPPKESLKQQQEEAVITSMMANTHKPLPTSASAAPMVTCPLEKGDVETGTSTQQHAEQNNTRTSRHPTMSRLPQNDYSTRHVRIDHLPAAFNQEENLPGAFSVQGIGASLQISSNSHFVEESEATVAETEPVIGDTVILDEGEEKEDEHMMFRHRSSRRTVEVIEAKIIPEQEKSWKVYLLLAISCLLVVGLVVFLVVYLTPQEKTEEVPADHDANKTINQPVMYPPFQEDLPISIQKEIQTVHSPSYKANAWMWNDPYRDTYSWDRQKQRFDMAFLYYLTNGDHWFQNDNWLSYTESECYWFSQANKESIARYDDYPVCDKDSNLLKISLASNNLQGIPWKYSCL